MALTNARFRRSWKLLLLGTLMCAVMLLVSMIVLKMIQLNYGSLMFSNNETPEDMCDCNKILQGDADEIKRAKILTITKHFKEVTRTTNEQYVEQTKDCDKFLRTHKYPSFPLSEEEEEFPVAYSIVVHHKVQNFERLLRSIYSPQNFYCIHVDRKAPTSFILAVTGIVSCIDNVFLASKLEHVVYAGWTRVQADINCMNDLYQVSSRWKYFINLCGQDFPLKTNLEIVRALKALAGANSLESEKTPANKLHRWKKRHVVEKGIIYQTNEVKSSPPFGIKIFTGGAYIIVTRDFVRYVLEDPKAQVLMSWINDTYSPDEFLWATMQRIPGVPGSLRTHPKFDVSDVFSISRAIKWLGHEGNFDAVYPACQGIHVREVCVYGVGDLRWLLQQHHLFANKFDTDFDPIVMRCLEKYLRHKALENY